MDVTLTFNGFDFSPKLSTYHVAYEVGYRKTVAALDGTEYVGNPTKRPIVTFTLFPATDEQEQAYYDALSVMIGLCTFTDPYADNASRTLRMRLTSNLESAFGLRSVDGNRYYKGGQIVLRGVNCVARNEPSMGGNPK